MSLRAPHRPGVDFNTTFVGWKDERGFHVVALDTGRKGCAVRWSLRSTEWRSWRDGAPVIASAITGDVGVTNERSKQNKLAEVIATGDDDWDLAGTRVGRWLTEAGDTDTLSFGTERTGRFWVTARARLPAANDAAGFGMKTVLSAEPHGGEPILLSHTQPKWHRLASVTKDLGIAVYHICRDVRTAAEVAAAQERRPFLRQLQVPTATRGVTESHLPGRSLKRAKRGDATRTATGDRELLDEARERMERDNRTSETPWIALEWRGTPLWETQLPDDPMHNVAILKAMEKLSRGLRTGNPRQTRQGVMEFDVQRGGAAFRVIYNEHHDTSTFVVLGVVKKGRGDSQQKALSVAGEAWRCFTAGDPEYSVSRVDPSRMQKALTGRGSNVLA